MKCSDQGKEAIIQCRNLEQVDSIWLCNILHGFTMTDDFRHDKQCSFFLIIAEKNNQEQNGLSLQGPPKFGSKDAVQCSKPISGRWMRSSFWSFLSPYSISLFLSTFTKHKAQLAVSAQVLPRQVQGHVRVSRHREVICLAAASLFCRLSIVPLVSVALFALT